MFSRHPSTQTSITLFMRGKFYASITHACRMSRLASPKNPPDERSSEWCKYVSIEITYSCFFFVRVDDPNLWLDKY